MRRQGNRERPIALSSRRVVAVRVGRRCHRDGQHALIYYAYAEGTVEEKVAATVIARMAAMDGMAGDDTTLIDDIARIIEASSAERAAA